jgi:hypothetical protein
MHMKILAKGWLGFLVLGLSHLAEASQGTYTGRAAVYVSPGETFSMEMLVEEAKANAERLADADLRGQCTSPIRQLSGWSIHSRDPNQGFGMARAIATAAFGCD